MAAAAASNEGRVPQWQEAARLLTAIDHKTERLADALEFRAQLDIAVRDVRRCLRPLQEQFRESAPSPTDSRALNNLVEGFVAAADSLVMFQPKSSPLSRSDVASLRDFWLDMRQQLGDLRSFVAKIGASSK
jgi:hypothetical protein